MLGLTFTKLVSELLIIKELHAELLEAMRALPECKYSITLKDAFHCMGWAPVYEGEDIVDISPAYKDLRAADTEMFRYIAPFVTEGSYISLLVEDSFVRFHFTAGSVHLDTKPYILYPDDVPSGMGNSLTAY